MAVPDVPVAMVHNQFFDEFTDKVRMKPIPWEGYSRAGLISSEDLGSLKEFQHEQTAAAEIAKKPLREFVPLLVKLVEKLSSIDALQYLLVALDDLVEQQKDSVEAFLNIEEDVFRVLFKCMEKKDDYLGLKAAKIAVGIIGQAPAHVQKNFKFSQLFGYLLKSLKSELTSVVDVAIQVIQSILRIPRTRLILYNDSTPCLNQLVDILKKTPGSKVTKGVVAIPQTQYEIIFCLWLLTFEPTVALSINKKYDVVPVMVDIARSTVKEKVIRIIVETWKNLLDPKVASGNVANLIVGKVPSCLETLSGGRNFKDEDLKEGIKQVLETLNTHTGVMTTWDEYLNEVKSGKLEWSPAHKSEQFWKLHVKKMDESDHKVVRDLVKVLMNPSAGETPLAVACHDLTQYVKFNPDGKKLLAKVGAKAKVMALMTSEFPEVRYEALMCVQQIMLNAWKNE
ncbi:H(+)-transporting V1 sector ATPase subunit H [Dipsacomyces acuminosporus]|nr:H(+)-transporting V1 sector ATPase subunit H [Dipsacomyces acuminosporus]